MAQPKNTTKYLIIPRDNLRNFLAKVLGESAADQTVSDLEQTINTIDLEPGDRVVKWSHVQDAVNALTTGVMKR